MLRNFILTLLSFTIFSQGSFAADAHINGRVLDLYTGTAIPGVEVFSKSQGVVTDVSGEFRLILDQNDKITVRCMGYETQVWMAGNAPDEILLKTKVLAGQSIRVTANRVIPGITPVAYSVLDADEIKARYSVEDVPMILSSEAGVHAYSESGNGTGYSYVSIRGFDQSRISVMLDNVPLNDNESHQVYWVDHGDILSNAEDVEIQRGVGNSLYGASAFGGSININTAIRSEQETLDLQILKGSYNTEKVRVEYQSGKRFGDPLGITARFSVLNSDGYRIDSRSEQRSLMVAMEHRAPGLTNQIRAILGKEYSVLQWDGVSIDYLHDSNLRRQKMSWTVPFTDDYFQQIYSLNTHFLINQHSSLRNVAYLVVGKGYYEVEKFNQDYFSYNLDVNDFYPDSTEMLLETSFLRRKWINNYYYGIAPVWTFEAKQWRTDIGLELRRYTGDHFGELLDITDSTLTSLLPDPYQYYAYEGNKYLVTTFGHVLVQMSTRVSATLDLRAQYIDWNLDQQQIGHASGVNLNASWQFLDPRIGLRYELSEKLSAFAGIGSAHKEPADAQIIEADDVWSIPVSAPAEGVINSELGLNWFSGQHQFSLNLYRIAYQNELLSDIYDFQDGSFGVRSAEVTQHQGIEFDLRTVLNRSLKLNVNGSFAQHRFIAGELQGNRLANVPEILANGQIRYEIKDQFFSALNMKYVGKQYIDQENSEALSIPGYLLTDLSIHTRLLNAGLQFRINNVFDQKYATYGYAYYGGYYWPGATRNYSISLSYQFH